MNYQNASDMLGDDNSIIEVEAGNNACMKKQKRSGDALNIFYY